MRVEFPPGIAFAELSEDVADLLVPAGHPLAASDGPVRLADTADERWIAALPGTMCYKWLPPSALSRVRDAVDGRGRRARDRVHASVVVRPVAALRWSWDLYDM
jgi:DNA-binding transcriptional LysR family regulator